MSRLKGVIPTVSRTVERSKATATAAAPAPCAQPAPSAGTATEADIEKHLAVQTIIRGYQVSISSLIITKTIFV